MIKELNIKNYAIIDESNIRFGEGLNIITGETGAGKSILLGALSLILGERADLKALLNKDKKCIVEGVFSVEDYNLQSFFENNELDYEDELIIRREITPSGKSRAFINDTPAVLQTLKSLSSQLIDLHRQFETLEIHQENFQMNILDVTAGIKKKVLDFGKKHSEYREILSRITKLETLRNEGIQRQDFLRFQLNELSELSLEKGESEQLGEKQKTLSNATEIKQNLSNVTTSLESFEGGIIDQLRDLSRSLSNVSSFSGNIEENEKRLLAVVEELTDINAEVTSIDEGIEYDPQRLSEIENRLHSIFKLTQKHGVTDSDELLKIQDVFEQELIDFQSSEGEISQLVSEAEKTKSILIKEAELISKKRHSVINKIEKSLKTQLEELAMPHASIKVELSESTDILSNGMNNVRFLFSANKGFELKPLKNVASGGELSRINLCIKTLVAGKEHLPTLVFDEIDTGISGDVAFKMGKMMATLAKNHQIISITHSPQVASRADEHFVVEKSFVGNTTQTHIRTLESKERIIEVAKMLSGNPPSDAAMANAKELIAS